MYENVHPKLALVLLLERTEVKCGKVLLRIKSSKKHFRTTKPRTIGGWMVSKFQKVCSLVYCTPYCDYQSIINQNKTGSGVQLNIVEVNGFNAFKTGDYFLTAFGDWNYISIISIALITQSYLFFFCKRLSE